MAAPGETVAWKASDQVVNRTIPERLEGTPAACTRYTRAPRFPLSKYSSRLLQRDHRSRRANRRRPAGGE